MTHLMQTYNRLPVSFVRGEGVWLWDDQGKKYLDAMAGIAVCGLGHAHPSIAQTICRQANQLLHTSNWFHIPHQEQLANRLCAISGMENVFFSNSGAEANEAAIKIARKYGNQRAIATPGIIVMENSFHGRTMATLTATGNRKIQAGFEPLVQGFIRVPFNDLNAVAHIAQNSKNVVAILVEPVQGEGGIQIPDRGYLKSLREICDQNGWFLMLDEIQTGMCRTGRWFACDHDGIKPDVLTVAKSLGNGIPIGACLARGAAATQLLAGNHGSTFGGNPFSCAVALAVVETMEKQNMAAHAEKLGTYIVEQLGKTLASQSCVKAIRGYGMMIGIELDRPCRELMTSALRLGLVINVTAENVIRLLPPLIYSATDADLLVSRLGQLIADFAAA